MRKYIIAALLLAMFTHTDVNAALLVKKITTTHEVVTTQSAIPAANTRIWHKVAHGASSAIKLPFVHKRHNMGELPKGVYIAMCILPLGWLAIAINSNFTENEWIFALLWYVLLYLPGVYYSLRQMKRFYGR